MAVDSRPPGDRQVDDLRQQLRALGYLDAGVDRFVLAPALGARRPTTIAGLASTRIGILGALLFGPASTFWIHERLPGLITGTRDAIVIACYLSALFGLATTAAAFLASLGVSWLARRPGSLLARQSRVLSVAAGVIVTCACLAYLTIWWQQASLAGTGSRIAFGLALLFSVAVSLLLGHAVTVTTLALVVARSGAVAQLKGVPGASSKVTLGAATIALCGALLLLYITTPFEQPAGDVPKLTVIPSGARVRLFAIDGFDDAISAELIKSGRVPALASAVAGARARTPAAAVGSSPGANDPARTWTTVATGQPPEVHGVESLETRRLAGVEGTLSVGRAVRAATDLVRLTRPSIASGTERRAKTFWEVAADAGLRTVVVNWWATWPAPADSGVILSDRATLRLEHGGTLDAEIAPAEVYERLRTKWPAIRRQATSHASQALAGAQLPANTAALLQRSAELDALELALAREVSTPDTDLLVVYLPGLDIAQHTLLSGDEGAQAPSALAARIDALKQYYIALDRLLSPMLSNEADVITLLVTAPGRVTAGGSTGIAMRGSLARADAEMDARLTDIAPTVLYALGVPVSASLAGKPLLGLFRGDFTQRYPVREVATYGQPSTRRVTRAGQPLDQEAIDRLRSLGYVR
ncbi:MAG TPA: alkaline phosphatase family protein [Vicinamibacterales bacterium]|jgi:hypothetical protein|nr:alkaline phosphatase family protein [Vicinamibacterales bacterium]